MPSKYLTISPSFYIRHLHMHVLAICHVYADAHGGQKRALGSPGAGVSGNCEILDVGAGNQTLVLFKSSKCS